MARERIWNNLTPTYQKRLSRAGVSKAQYESGASLKSARGHKLTPERPADYAKNPAKYKEYGDNRKRLAAAVRRRKEGLFSDRLKYSPERARELVNKGTVESGIPTVASYKWFLNATEDEILARMPPANNPEDVMSFMWYH